MGVVGWDYGCRLAAERKVSYRTGIAEQASVDTSVAGGGTGREEIKYEYQHIEVG